jgi:hypothetical protein
MMSHDRELRIAKIAIQKWAEYAATAITDVRRRGAAVRNEREKAPRKRASGFQRVFASGASSSHFPGREAARAGRAERR